MNSALSARHTRFGRTGGLKHSWLFWLFALLAFSVIYTISVIDLNIGLLVSIVILIAPLLLYTTLMNTTSALIISVLFLPLIFSPIINPPLLGLSGMKPFSLLAAIACVAALFDRRLYIHSDPIDRTATKVFFAYFAIWSLTFVRSVPNHPRFFILAPTYFPSTTVYYVFQFYVIPSIYAAFFLIVLKLMRSERAVQSLVRLIAFSMFIFSCVVIVIISLHSDVFAHGRGLLTVILDKYLGLSYNRAGTMYIILGPIILYMAIEKRWFWTINFILATFVVLLLQSRSTLVVYFLMCFVTLILMGRRRMLLVALAVLGITATSFALIGLAPSLKALLSVGVQPGNVESLDAFLSGRLLGLWAPLLQQWVEDPLLFLFGAGRIGMMTSNIYVRGAIYGTHPHNALIEVFLDGGIGLAILAVVAIGVWLRSSWRLGRRMNDPLFWALFCSVLGYLVGSLTERSFFPNFDSFIVFVILALQANVARNLLHSRESPSTPEYEKEMPATPFSR